MNYPLKSKSRLGRTGRRAGIVLALAAAASAAGTAGAQNRVVPDTFLATTTAMEPTGVEIKADVIRWSSNAERAAVIAALHSEDPADGLKELPTMGVVWREGSAVGNSIKYAYRSDAEGDGERITLITDRRIAYTSLDPWTADRPAADVSDAYTVIELVPGEGRGSMSLGADVSIDTDASLVSLANGSEPLLTEVSQAPKPYWARQE